MLSFFAHMISTILSLGTDENAKKKKIVKCKTDHLIFLDFISVF